MSAHAGVCVRTLVSHEVEMDGCFKRKERYNHLQLAACNNIHHMNIKTQHYLCYHPQWIGNHSTFTVHFIPPFSPFVLCC